ncbi:hypothetical protein M569_15372 [Genlisea aurea]|uniref:Uncharacterized protein n=1 Tax=Genlisea aurea TaxID=192259 RepID=S8DIY3_9LAMI|nr:hypothetical protein M569_15372 [Genlisea aurea]
MLLRDNRGNDMQGTQTVEKNELLDELSGRCDYYSTLPSIYRLGSSVFWDEADGEKRSVVVRHCNIIDSGFWDQHPEIIESQ